MGTEGLAAKTRDDGWFFVDMWAVLFAVSPIFAAPVPDREVMECYDDVADGITYPDLA